MTGQSAVSLGSFVPIISLMVTLLVAVIAIIGNIINERYKRHQSRIAVAAVMRAEIAAKIATSKKNKTAELWAAFATELESEKNVAIPAIYVPDVDPGPIFHAYVDKFGLLDHGDAEMVIQFFEYLLGIRVITKNLTNGSFESHPQAAAIKASQIRTGLRFWNECQGVADKLLPSLERVSQEPFAWLPKRQISSEKLNEPKRLA
jgi:hypothetical protein